MQCFTESSETIDCSKCPIKLEVKSLFRDVLNLYIEKNLLNKYSSTLKKVINKLKISKVASFLESVSAATSNEQSSPGLGASVSPKDWYGKYSYESLSTQRTLLSQIGRKLSHMPSSDCLTSSPVQTLSPLEKVISVLRQEVRKEDNVFFEMVHSFGIMYAQNYAKELQEFEVITERISKNDLLQELFYDHGWNLRKENAYLEAVKDIKQFEEFIYNSLKVLMIEISNNLNGDDSLVPSKKVLYDLTAKLLFRQAKCYQTLFSLIRYYTIQEEIILKRVFNRFKSCRPEIFGLDRKFCLEKEEIPYGKVIESLDYLDVFTDPNDKFQLIFCIRKQIFKCLQAYRSKEGLGMETIAITGDQLLPLYTYCLAINSNEKLRAHQLFVETFLDKDTLILDEEGYCFSTFVGAVDSLVGRKTPRVSLENRDRSRPECTENLSTYKNIYNKFFQKVQNFVMNKSSNQ